MGSNMLAGWCKWVSLVTGGARGAPQGAVALGVDRMGRHRHVAEDPMGIAPVGSRAKVFASSCSTA